MAKLGFIGLGQMGAPMARRLLDAGHDLVVWNRTPARAEPLVSVGAAWADSAAGVAAGAEAIFTMLASPAAVERVVLGDDGIATGISSGTTLIEMSTIGPDAIRRIAQAFPRGVEVVDAPVLGSTPQAQDGTLVVFVGAPADTFARLRDLLEALGDPIHVGPFGSGAAIKLAINSTLGLIQLAFGEALALAGALGLDLRRTLDLLELSPISPTVKKKREGIETGIFEPNFKLSLAAKDMTLVTETARERGIELQGAAAARAAFEAAAQAGLGDCDYSAVAAYLSGRPAAPE
jgi:3-hydroxyisobutyrate dehydrogenase-like beta-hydroxyacid dehydrogenase